MADHITDEDVARIDLAAATRTDDVILRVITAGRWRSIVTRLRAAEQQRDNAIESCGLVREHLHRRANEWNVLMRSLGLPDETGVDCSSGTAWNLTAGKESLEHMRTRWNEREQLLDEAVAVLRDNAVISGGCIECGWCYPKHPNHQADCRIGKILEAHRG